MNRDGLASKYEDRLRQYCGLASMPSVRIELTCDEGRVETYEAQFGLITAASLLGRIFGQVHADVPAVPLHPAIVHSERTLAAALERELVLARPLELRGSWPGINAPRLLRMHWGDGKTADINFFGYSWNGSVGTKCESASLPVGENPFGPAMAAILACTEAFLLALNSSHAVRVASVNTWHWSLDPSAGPAWRPGLELGEVWTVGVGSVGTAALHFLILAKLKFAAAIFDRDKFKIENISRSPIFSAEDNEGESKVDIVAHYLRANGIVVRAEPTWLHESPLWLVRPPGQPDLLISTANEHHVRWHIESAYPPVQLHASTGRNWQATLFRHIPIIDPCSLCIFPDEGISAQPVCATGEVIDPSAKRPVDASLPFLSYAAGLMVAVEAYKLACGKDQVSRRVFLQMRGDPLVLPLPMSPSAACSCRTRQARVHLAAIQGGRFAHMSVPTAP